MGNRNAITKSYKLKMVNKENKKRSKQLSSLLQTCRVRFACNQLPS